MNLRLINDIQEGIVRLFYDPRNPERIEKDSREWKLKLIRFLINGKSGDNDHPWFYPVPGLNITRSTFYEAVETLRGFLQRLIPSYEYNYLKAKNEASLSGYSFNSINLESFGTDSGSITPIFFDFKHLIDLPGKLNADILSVAARFYGATLHSFLKENDILTKNTKAQSDHEFNEILIEIDLFLTALREGPYCFYNEEFDNTGADIEGLCSIIKKNGYSYLCKSRDNTLDRLNELIRFSNLYEELSINNPSLKLPDEMMDKQAIIKNSREAEYVGRFNRLILETLYPDQVPRRERIDESTYKFIRGLANQLQFDYSELIRAKQELTERDADRIVSRIEPPEMRSIFKNMLLKEPVICQYKYKGVACGALFLRNKGSNRVVCFKHTPAEKRRYERSLNGVKPRGGRRSGAGRPKKS